MRKDNTEELVLTKKKPLKYRLFYFVIFSCCCCCCCAFTLKFKSFKKLCKFSSFSLCLCLSTLPRYSLFELLFSFFLLSSSKNHIFKYCHFLSPRMKHLKQHNPTLRTSVSPLKLRQQRH